jgi:hypothetical protein
MYYKLFVTLYIKTVKHSKYMKDTQSKESQNEIGVTAPVNGEFKWKYSEVKNNHERNLNKFLEIYKPSNDCVVCGRDSQIGSDFCSIKCQKDQYGV